MSQCGGRDLCVCVQVGAGLGTDAVVLVDPREAPGTVGEVDHLKETGG